MHIFLASSVKRAYTTLEHFRKEMLKEGIRVYYYGSTTSNGGQIDDNVRGGIKAANLVLAFIQEGDEDEIEQIERSIRITGEFYKPIQIIIQNTALTPDLQAAYPDAIIFDEAHPEKIQEIISKRAEAVYQSPDVNFKKEVIWKLYELAAKYFVETYQPVTQVAVV